MHSRESNGFTTRIRDQRERQVWENYGFINDIRFFHVWRLWSFGLHGFWGRHKRHNHHQSRTRYLNGMGFG
ncbi:hypothetical protein ACSBR1_012170 [Camellia fascicularis]